jgi:hypothetical protein
MRLITRCTVHEIILRRKCRREHEQLSRSYNCEWRAITFARPDFDGRLRSADEVHAMSLADLDGEYCTVINTEAVLRG